MSSLLPNSVTFPQGNVLLRNLHKNYPVATHGKGIYIFDSNGNKYFDASGGALVCSLGHGLEDLAQEVFEQMKQISYLNGMQFTSPIMEECAERLAQFAKPLGLDKVALLSSGSEAVEAAIKYARQLQVDRGFPKKSKLIARTPGYHGNTLYALSASGRPHYKKVYGPLISEVLTVSTPYGYRSPFATEQEYFEKGEEHYAKELEAVIAREGADTIFAFIFEPVSGSSTGGWAPPYNYFKRISEICKKNSILMIADEVLCGAGRTGTFFACEQLGPKDAQGNRTVFQPDLLVLGKGINAGLMPVSAVLVRGSDVETMKNGTGNYMHAQTYMQVPILAATANAVLKYFQKHSVLEQAKPVSEHFQTLIRKEILKGSFQRSEHVGTVTGLGHIAGVELVKDRASKTPFPIEKKFALKFVAHAQEPWKSNAGKTGLILWPNYGQADGTNGDLVLLGPSLLMTKEEANECVALLKEALETFKIE